MTGMDVLGLTASNPGQHKTSNAHPYSSSVASSASSSSSSIFSLDCMSSQSSISSSSTTAVDVIWENEVSGDSAGRGLPHLNEHVSRCSRGGITKGCSVKAADTAVPPELRKHPRRTCGTVAAANGTATTCARLPPPLVRQCDRKVTFVDNLVDSASQIVETIWPLSVVALRSDSSMGCKGVLPLRTFIQETLRRSRTSYSTLQVALYYLIKIRPHVPNHDFTMEQPRDKPIARAMQCGRRMFLAALILASKYLQDRNYSARAWSKISGLNTLEINQNEMMFLQAVDWKLHIPEAIYHRWTDVVLKYTPTPAGPSKTEGTWRSVIPKLTPELDTIDVEPSGPSGFLAFDTMADALSPRSSCTRDGASNGMLAFNDHTPTQSRNPPLVLEPTPRVDSANPALPSLPKLGLLPTPQLTPQSSAVSTPAASMGGVCSGRPSIGAALSQAQSMCIARSTFDQRLPPPFGPRTSGLDGYPALTRRSSLARSASSASSPESMISDVSTISSRSSRSSSISSCASATCAPSQPRLAVTATRRCAANSLKECRKNLVIQSPINETSMGGMYSSPDTDAGLGSSVPDFSNFSLNTPVDLTTHEAAQGLCELSGAMPRSNSPLEPVNEAKRCRKRGRTSSGDQLLQNNVRHLMAMHVAHEHGMVTPDHSVADSFLLAEPTGLQSPLDRHLCSIKLPVPVAVQQGGIKRACWSSETRRVVDSRIRSGCMN